MLLLLLILALIYFVLVCGVIGSECFYLCYSDCFHSLSVVDVAELC